MKRGMRAIDEELRYFEKWVAISIIIGIISGLGAVIFHIAIELSIEFFLGNIAGYIPPRPGSNSVTFVLPQNNLLLILPPVIGGLLSGFLVFKFAPEAEGHGTDAAIEAFHYKEGAVRSRVPLIKLVASAITIGSGGSAGKEGPVAQIGSGFGSLLAEKLKLSPKDRRIALAVGVGSGIGAIFKAPFGGAIFASEVLYIMDFEPEVIPPAFIASLISYIIMGLYSGWSHVFWAPSLTNIASEIYNLPTLLLFAILGFINGIVGIIYVKTFYGVRSLFRRLERVPDILKPAIGGLFTGIIGVFFPYILESSYGWLQMLINGNFEYIPIYVLILLPFLKILATSLSISSGGSGGVFAPALVIGGSIGALVWHIAKTIMPGYNIPVGVYVIIGMMSFFGGIGKVPIATILMVGEMTGEYQLFAPSLIATTISYLITGKNSIYISQIFSRIESPAHGGSKIGLLRTIYDRLKERDSHLLEKLKARDLMVEPLAKVHCKDKVSKIVEILRKYPFRIYPVVDEKDRFMGFIRVEDIPLGEPRALEMEIMFLPMLRGFCVTEEETLETILEKMIENELDKVAVVDRDYKLLGIITAKEILKNLTRYLVK